MAHRFLILTSILATATSLFGQDFPTAPQLDRPAPMARPAAPVVPPEVAAIKVDFDEMSRYLTKKGSVSKDDIGAIRKLGERVAPHAQANDPTALAMQVQIGTWLDDPALVDASYIAILAMNDRNDIALAQWLAAMNRRLDYERCVNEALAHGPAMAASTRVSLAAIEALLGLNRVGEAKVRLDSIMLPPNERPDIASRYNAMKARVDALFPLWQQEDAARQAETTTNTLPRVELTTAKGTIVIELYEEQAPNSAAAFLEFAGSGAYDGTTFHKRVTGVGMLGGDPNSKAGAKSRPGTGSPGFRIADEGARPDRRVALSGTVGFAKAEAPKPTQAGQAQTSRTTKDSAGQTFFILTSPAEHLHDEFTIVGRVVDGFETVLRLTPSDAITSAKVLRKREHEYVVQKSPELSAPAELIVVVNAPKAPTGGMPGATPGGTQPIQIQPGRAPAGPTAPR
jgi:cyclophilin family peptidyl-prolyl cis-trans isomerase